MMMPLIYFGFIGMFVYVDETNILLKLVGGIFVAGLLGLLGWCLKSLFVMMLLPLGLMISTFSRAMTRKLIYCRKEEEEQEKQMGDLVRKTDPLFSLQSFFGGIQNKLAAIHYADFRRKSTLFPKRTCHP